MKNIKLLACCLAIALMTGLMTHCNKEVRFNDVMVYEYRDIQHRVERLMGKPTIQLDKTPETLLDDLKKEIEDAIETVDELESNGTDEAEDLRDAVLDLFEFYENGANDVFPDMFKAMGEPGFDRQSYGDRFRAFVEREKELVDAVKRAQEIYAESIDAEL